MSIIAFVFSGVLYGKFTFLSFVAKCNLSSFSIFHQMDDKLIFLRTSSGLIYSGKFWGLQRRCTAVWSCYMVHAQQPGSILSWWRFSTLDGKYVVSLFGCSTLELSWKYRKLRPSGQYLGKGRLSVQKQGMCLMLKKTTGRDAFLHQEGGW
jgi:hypothetical protein